MFGLFKSKVWQVGEHRVKKTTVPVRKRQAVPHGSPASETKTVRKTRYKCVDCERVLKDREEFADGDYDCYDIVQE